MAQSLVWDPDGATDGAQDGGGTWNTSNTNWLPTASSTSDNNTSWPGGPTGLATTAIFGNGGVLTDASRVITVASGISVGGLTFKALNLTVNTNRAYRFTGGSLTFKDGAIIEIGQGATTTTVGQRIEMNTSIGGSNVIIRQVAGATDVGLMQFEAANTWTGTLGLEGQLFIDIRNYNSISTLGAINVGTGATLVINYTGAGTTLNVPLTLAGVGSTSRGAIRFDQSQTLAGAITLADTAGISANGNTGTLTGNIGESGGSRQLRLNVNGTGGTIVLSGNNTFTGGLDIVSGTVRLGSTGALNASGVNLVTFSGTAARTLALNGFSTTVSGLVYTGTGLATITNTSATAATLTLNPASGTNSFTGVIADGAGGGALTLIKNGAGTQILTGTTASTYTGGTIFNAGILGISNDGNLGTVPGSASAANLTFNGGVLQFNATMELNANRGTTLQAGGGVFETGTGTTVTYGGAISGAAGSFTKRGAGTLALTGASNYSGQTLVTAGILSIRHNLALGSTAGETFVSGGAVLDLRNNVTITGETLYTPKLTSGDGNNTWAGTIRGAISQQLTLEVQSGNLLVNGNVNAASTDNQNHTLNLEGVGVGEISGVLSNTAAVNKSGTGTWRLSGNNTFASAVNLNEGRLIVANLGALNASTPNAVTFSANTLNKTLSVQAANVLAGGLVSSGGAGSIITENGGATDATLTLVVNTNRSYGGIIQDGAGGGKLGINMSGTAVQTLTGTGTYTGDTTLTSGTLRLDFSGAGAPTSNIASSSSTLVAAGGTLNVVGSSTGAVSQTFNGLRVTTGASTLSVTTNTTTAQDVLLSLGAITRTGGTVNFLLPNGAPSVTNGIRTTTGNTNGILGAWATVNGTDWATVDSNGNIIAYADYTNVTNFGSGAGAMGPIPDNIGANVKIVDGGTSGSITLADAGSDGVTLVNTIMQTATGAATITFGASPSGKILRLGEQGGIVMTNTAEALTIGTTANEGSILTMGGTTLNVGGDLLLNNASAAAMTINSNINDNGTGVVSLTKNGTGLLVLTGTGSTYSGGTFINAGTVRIMADRSLGAAPTAFDADNIILNGSTLQWGADNITLSSNRGITLLAGGTLDTQAFNTVYSGSITGSGTLNKLGTGELNLTQANTYTGTTNVSAGVLLVSHNNALGTTAGGTNLTTSAAILRLGNGVTVTGETLSIIGTGGNNNGNLQLVAGTSASALARATWAGDIIIANDNARIGTQDFGVLTVSGVIRSGAGNNLGISASPNGGVVVLAAQNTYTGSTSVIRGTLQLGINNALAASTVLSVHSTDATADYAGFEMNGFNQTVAGLRGMSRAVTTGATNKTTVTNSSGTTATLTVNETTTASSNVYFGEITGNLNLVKTGDGNLILENQTQALSNSYTGKTTIAAGTLALRNNGNLDGTPWVQIDSGALLSIAGRTGASYTITNKVLSGSGSVDGTLVVSGTSVIRPGSTGAGGTVVDAGAGFGELTFQNLTLAPGATRVELQLGGTNSKISDPLAGGNATYFSTADSGGLYDTLQVNGTLSVNDSSVIRVSYGSGYTAGWGDVFNLIDWATLNVNGDGAGGAGDFTLASLDISALTLSGGNSWATDRFLSDGIIYVVPEPSRAVLILAGLSLMMGRRSRGRKQA